MNDDAEILLDQTKSAWDLMCAVKAKTRSSTVTSSPVQVTIILDNCGLELVSDLVLVDALLATDMCDVVHLHCKADPVFVSDVMWKDIFTCLTWMESLTGFPGAATISSRLRMWIRSHRVVILPNSFYNSARAFWDMPRDIRSLLEGSCLTIGLFLHC